MKKRIKNKLEKLGNIAETEPIVTKEMAEDIAACLTGWKTAKGQPVTAARVIRMIREGVVEAVDGTTVELRPDSICLHGDSASAVEMAKTLRARLEENGVTIAPLKDVLRARK